MKDFLEEVLSGDKLWWLELVLSLGYAGWVGRELQLMADSGGSTPEKLIRSAACAIGAYLIAFLTAYLLRQGLPRRAYWIVGAICGAGVFGLARVTILFSYSSGRSALELLKENFGNVVVGLLFHTVFVSVPLLVALLALRSLYYFLTRPRLR